MTNLRHKQYEETLSGLLKILHDEEIVRELSYEEVDSIIQAKSTLVKVIILSE